MSEISKDILKVPFSLEKIIKGLPICAFVFSMEGKLLTWNKNVETLLGYSVDELNNKFASGFIYKEDKERVIMKFMEILAGSVNKEPFLNTGYRPNPARESQLLPYEVSL